MTDPVNETHSRILDAAEALFMRKGYTAVRLRDVADSVGMRHASLFYYVPGGKEQLYIAVVERSLNRHKEGLTKAIADAGDDFRMQMYAVADWFAETPPVDFGRIVASDLPEIDPHEAERLMNLTYDALRTPLIEMLQQAQAHNRIRLNDFNTAAMALVTLAQSAHGIPGKYPSGWKQRLGRQLVDMLLDGWLAR
ncbi:MAG: TetR/AcrR family transcriptional regulator [bacterium]|nr:TetR/AcrR family transcriptional regulator [bacterium]